MSRGQLRPPRQARALRKSGLEMVADLVDELDRWEIEVILPESTTPQLPLWEDEAKVEGES